MRQTCVIGSSVEAKIKTVAVQEIRQPNSSPSLISIPNNGSAIPEKSHIIKNRRDVRITKLQLRCISVSQEKAEFSFLDAWQSWLNIE